MTHPAPLLPAPTTPPLTSTSGRPDTPAAAPTPAPVAVRIVGIGCSAGGFDALTRFFAHVPDRSGLAFVVVQHLDPHHVSALPELLGQHTGMPVTEAADGAVVAADHVYVIPPNRDLVLREGSLHLLTPSERRGLRLPVDGFLRSLAEAQRELAIGMVLSGMGSDGVLGLRAIKEYAGLTLVQDPATAQSDSMPRSAMAAGVADIVAAPEALPARIAGFLAASRAVQGAEGPSPGAIGGVLDQITRLLRDHTGNDFSLYKANTLNRRIERRIAVHQLGSAEAYVQLLRGNPPEVDLLFKELLIGVTSFFRDPEVWELLRTEALPALLARHPTGAALRAWVPACSTGEEAYSLAMVFREVIEAVQPAGRFTLQIYGTDLDAEAVDRARKGVYPANIAADVSPERLARHFSQEEGGGYRINRGIRDMLVFARQNIISDPPFTRLDILCCRNLLIYFGNALQNMLLPVLHYALNPGGLLLLGSAESVGAHTQLFTPLNARARLFTSCQASAPLTALPLSTPPASPAVAPSDAGPGRAADDFGALTDQFIQQNFAPAAVLVNAAGDILYISGRTGKYLEAPAGKTNMNLHAMAREGLREALIGVLYRAMKQPGRPVQVMGVDIPGEGGGRRVDVTVQCLERPEALRGRAIVVFRDAPAPAGRTGARKRAGTDAHPDLMAELLQAREALQIGHEEMQTTVEELKSSNEELQSTNEELQSTNEELTTSKEELQSLNEELQTVNAELQSKVEDLTWVRNDMSNLLNSTEIATVFLDGGMKLRRFTTHATRLFRLIPGDVGRPLSHVVSTLDYPELQDDAQAVLRTLAFRETVRATRDGAWYRVRIMPYRTQDNVVDGVVITFIDITETHLLEARLRQRDARDHDGA